MSLPNDIILVICTMISPLTRSKLCQVNKQYYNVIILPLRDIDGYTYRCVRNYHLFILHYQYIAYIKQRFTSSKYLNDGMIDVDVAKLIWNCKRPRLKRCYDILFNAYKYGNMEYIHFIYPNIYKLCQKRHTQWDNARLRGAIAGGHVALVNKLWNGDRDGKTFEYAYECGQIKVIELLKSYGFKCDDATIAHAFYKNQVDVIYYEYMNNPKYIHIHSAKRLAIRKNHIQFIQTLMNDTVFDQWDLSYAQSYHCNKTTINLIQTHIDDTKH